MNVRFALISAVLKNRQSSELWALCNAPCSKPARSRVPHPQPVLNPSPPGYSLEYPAGNVPCASW